MSFLSSMKVSSRIALSFAVPMVVGTLIVAYSIVAMRTLEHEVNEVAKDRLAKVEALQEVRDGMALAATLASNAVITPEASARESEKRRILTLRAETQQKIAALDKKFVIPRSRELLHELLAPHFEFIHATHLHGFIGETPEQIWEWFGGTYDAAMIPNEQRDWAKRGLMETADALQAQGVQLKVRTDYWLLEASRA